MSKTIIHENEIIQSIKNKSPNINDVDLKWKLFNYCKMNNLKNIGSKKYISKDLIYQYKLSDLAENICQNLITEFPEIKTAVWETSILNEWLNLLLAKNVILVEVEKEFVETIYDHASSVFENVLTLVNPTIDDYQRYQADGLIVIRKLIDRSPVTKEHHITLEKLIVDLLCDKFLSKLFDKSVIYDLVNDASKEYVINKKKLLAYARRRGKYDEILTYWRNVNDKSTDL